MRPRDVDRQSASDALQSMLPLCDHFHISARRRHGMVSRNGETSSMIIIDALLIVALLFFLFLPITDRKTVRMKLAVVCAIAAVLVVSVMRTAPADLQLASGAR